MNEKKDLLTQDLSYLWHPFTQMQELRKYGGKIIIEGRGCQLRDIDGKEYIDGLAGLFTTVIGHGRKEMIEAMVKQAEKLEFVSLFDFFTHEPAIKLAMKLAEITPGDLQYVQFGCSGSDAVEIALKMAREYQRREGFSQRYKIIARRFSYHGVSMGALSATGLTKFREGFEPLVSGFRHIPWANCFCCPFGKKYPDCEIECALSLEKQIIFEGPESVAAFICEPVPITRGVVDPPPEYLPKIREICDKYGILFIADEISTGFGKLGTLFACELYKVVPDILVVGKALSSGYFPISAVIVKPKVYKAFVGPTAKEAFSHMQTYQGHPIGCAVALKNIEIIENEELVKRAEKMGKYLREKLESLLDLEIVANVRGKGLLHSIEFKSKCGDKKISYEMGIRIRERAYELGLICRVQANFILLSPPLIISKEEIDRTVEILRKTLSECLYSE